VINPAARTVHALGYLEVLINGVLNIESNRAYDDIQFTNLAKTRDGFHRRQKEPGGN
jgi:hypothetical protein